MGAGAGADAHARPVASLRRLLLSLVGATLLFAASVPLGPLLPVSPRLGAGVAFALVAGSVILVAVTAPTLSARRAPLIALPLLGLVCAALLPDSAPRPLGAALVNTCWFAFASLLGSAVGGRIEFAGRLVLLAWLASIVDVVSVFVPEGPTAQIVASPDVALPLLAISWPIFGTAQIEPFLGFGDITMAAVYGSAARVTGLRIPRLVGGLALGFALTFAALLVFERALPALPMLSVCVVVALAPDSLRLPPGDRKGGLTFAAIVTLVVAARLTTWLVAP